MCGIAGIHIHSGITDKATLSRMTDALSHRGPDAAGHYYSTDNTLGLGHRRLSIIDLSEGANQPIFSANGRYAIVYNGEVYNFQELRSKLPNFAWRTQGDTEVILELFAQYGAASFAWLNGMFALAIYDTQASKLYIARDHIGIKPLYYYHRDGVLLFASEIKAIVRSRIANLTIDKSAIPYFLHLGFIPQPLTIYQHIHKFPSGNYATIDTQTGSLEMRVFWSPATYYHPDTVIDESTALKQYQELLYSAVETQMISDVPLGTFLSGGIDSSLVTAVAAQISKQKVKTFSIGFTEAKYDESSHARAVAEHLGTDHHQFMVRIEDVLELVPSLMQSYDEPYADSSAFPTMLVSRLAREHVTVTLSGDGGDETFLGYGMYTWAERLDNPLLHTFRKPLYQLSQQLGNRYKRAGTLLNYTHRSHLHSHIFSQEQYLFSEQELNGLMSGISFNFDTLNTIAVSPGNAAERQAFWDLGYYLRDDLLVKVDRASMKYSLESRVPLLDTRLIEFALQLPYQHKIRAGYGTKYLMKKTLYDLVPRAIFERPKRGFSIPLAKWLKGELRYLIDQHLHPDWVATCALVNPAVVSTLLKRFDAGEDYLYNRIWVLLLLHWWMKENNAA
jgi:asparagine synthase (glutamine-hydrolysing)